MPANPLARLLKQNAELEPVSDRLELIRVLQKRYRGLAPENLAAASRVCAIEGTTVVILADNAPVATALRALAPRLLEGLCASARSKTALNQTAVKPKQYQEFTGVRIEVQVASGKARRTVYARGKLPKAKLGEVAEGLSDSPLKEALRRIAAKD
jgi:hypothetical protein